MLLAVLRDLAVLGALVLVVNVGTAQACSSTEPEQTRAQLFARASSIFTAHLLRTEEIPATGRPIADVEATFRTIEVFKGQPPATGKVRTLVYGPGNCSVPLLAGADYLLFLYDSDYVLLLPGGSELIWNLEGRVAKKLLAELRELAKKTP
jgi:hypothetical protein